jgi:hypothetical protein
MGNVLSRLRILAGVAKMTGIKPQRLVLGTRTPLKNSLGMTVVA